jgi:hypothetical protein
MRRLTSEEQTENTNKPTKPAINVFRNEKGNPVGEITEQQLWLLEPILQDDLLLELVGNNNIAKIRQTLKKTHFELPEWMTSVSKDFKWFIPSITTYGRFEQMKEFERAIAEQERRNFDDSGFAFTTVDLLGNAPKNMISTSVTGGDLPPESNKVIAPISEFDTSAYIFFCAEFEVASGGVLLLCTPRIVVYKNTAVDILPKVLN